MTTTLESIPCAVCGSTDASPARMRAPRDDHAAVLELRGGRSQWVVCNPCGLVYQSPRPGPDAVSRLYLGGDYHETRGGVPEHYIQYSLRRSVAALDWALAHPGLDGAPGRAMDIGCGIGGALVHLRDRGWDVVGVEPDDELASVGRSRFGLEITTGVLDGATSRGTDFDLAYSCHVWEHLADPVDTSGAARGLLKGGSGHLMIVVPTFRQARTLAWSCFTGPHTYMFTEVSLGNVLACAGFDVVDFTFHAGADSELWLLAKAQQVPGAATPRREAVSVVQRELALVPLRAPLGLPARLTRHVRTLASDPADFVRRAGRWVGYRRNRLRAMTGR